jgi:hypothetical protein
LKIRNNKAFKEPQISTSKKIKKIKGKIFPRQFNETHKFPAKMKSEIDAIILRKFKLRE